MTCIAVRNGIIASDRMVTTSEDTIPGYRTKVHRAGGVIFGTCGYSQDSVLFQRWVEAGRPDEKPQLDEKFMALLIESDGTVIHYPGGKLVDVRLEGEYFAIGGGDGIALGAMYMGATAKEAVEAACKHNCGCGGGVDSLSLNLPAANGHPDHSPQMI